MANSPKFCRNCGSPLKEGVKFCAKCGQQVQFEAAKPAQGNAQDQTSGRAQKRAASEPVQKKAAPVQRNVRQKAESAQENTRQKAPEPAAEPAYTSDAAPRKSGGNKIFILIAIIAVAAGFAVGGLFFLKMHKGGTNADSAGDISVSAEEETVTDDSAEPEEDEDEEAEEKVYEVGTWSGDVYTNDSLGITFTLPDGWTRGTSDEADALLGLDSEDAYQFDFYIYDETDNIQIIAFAMDCDESGTDHEKDLLDGITEEASGETGYETVGDGEIATVTLGETEFSGVSFLYSEDSMTLYDEMYAAQYGDTLVEISAVYHKNAAAEYASFMSTIQTGGIKIGSYAVQDSDYILPESNTSYLTKEDLEGLTQEECRLARNEIYARHGRKFDDETLTEYFSQFDWYEPTIDPDDFSESMLNEYELANRDLIVEYEEEMGYR